MVDFSTREIKKSNNMPNMNKIIDRKDI